MSIKINYSLKKKEGLEELNNILADQSFIGGHAGANSCDVDVLNALGDSDFSEYPNIKRWHKYVTSFTKEERKAWNTGFIAIEGYEPVEEVVEEEEVNLFDDVTEEEAKALEEKKKEDEKKKQEALAKGKKVIIEKSSILIDIKPLSDEVNMVELENAVRQIKLPSLKWQAAKLVDVAYGIKKLQILCTIEDAKVTGEDLEDKIMGLSDMVQSMDIAAWNKCG